MKDTDLKTAVSLAYHDSLQPESRKERQIIDVQEDNLPEPLSEVEVDAEKEVGEMENEDSHGGSADGDVGDLLGSGKEYVQVE